MKTFLSRHIGQVIVSLVAISALGGCAVYTPAPSYVSDGGVVYAAPAPVPAPVYTAPVYVGPPVYFGFGFSTWGGRGWGHRGWGGRGWGGRGRW